jgi:hypothetical protein
VQNGHGSALKSIDFKSETKWSVILLVFSTALVRDCIYASFAHDLYLDFIWKQILSRVYQKLRRNGRTRTILWFAWWYENYLAGGYGIAYIASKTLRN